MADALLGGTSPVPAAGLLAAWGTAFLRGRAAPDDLLAALDGPRPHRVVGLSPDDGPVGLVVALAALRSAGVTALRPVLPVPGDVLGVPGPAPFVRAATTAGQAVCTMGPPWWGLVPGLDEEAPDAPVVWAAMPVEPTVGSGGLPSLAEADRELAEAMHDGTAALAALDLAAGRDDVDADLARSWRRVPRSGLPDVLPARAVALLDRASRVAAIVALAERHDGAAVTAAEAAARAAALRPLARAARHALAAAFAAAGEPVTQRD